MKSVSILIAALFLLSACSKVDLHSTDSQTSSQPPPESARLVEIDKELAQAPTGTSENAEHRAKLRAERDSLTGASRIVSVQNAVSSKTASPVYRPSVSTQQPGIVVARDSQSTPATRWSGYESLTPSEKKDYLRALRTTNSNQVIVEHR